MSVVPSITGFRWRVLLGMMLVVGSVTALALWVAQDKVTADVHQQLQKDFQSELDNLHRAREVRQVALVERSRALARKPRIHAALEDGALDLLYPNAEDELRDVMSGGADTNHPLRARFYRFLDIGGKVIAAPEGLEAGKLNTADEAKLSLTKLSDTNLVGYIDSQDGMTEIIAAPIFSTETGEVIASIVLGFKPFDLGGHDLDMKAGIWTKGALFLPDISVAARATLSSLLGRMPQSSHIEATLDGTPYLIFSHLLNADSLFPPAYEVCVYSLAESVKLLDHLRWQILGAGLLLLLAASAASHFIAGRLSVPVEQLVVDSAHNVVRREHAEAALVQTSADLLRSARFSADTSHQLKTPVTVLRAGLDELQEHPEVTADMRVEIAELISQTTKISSMIHDLLLLSRLDAGRLSLEMRDVDLTKLIDSMADDLSALPTAPDFDVEVDVPCDMHVLGEKRYISMIIQNLLENAWKYNEPGGRIAISAHETGDVLSLRVGNTGPGIPIEAQEHIFERFHRAAVGENVPGHGLGLNIARELALLHGGDLRLLSSTDQWTEFEVSFRAVKRPDSE